MAGGPKSISSGMADAWIPYGVGERTCPGRFFAKREIILFCAEIVSEFDLELLATEKHFKANSRFYGLGTQRSLNEIPFRLRRRHLDH